MNIVADTKADAELALVAFQWWMEKRPSGWTIAQHLNDPAVNCSTPVECKLAHAVADWARGGQ